MKTTIAVIALILLHSVSMADEHELQKPEKAEKKIVADKTIDYTRLHEAADKTLKAWSQAVAAGKGERSGAIPSKYWADPIPALKPLAVREHTLSLLIAMEQTESSEKGLFFLSPLSSRIPSIMLQKAGEVEKEPGATEEFFDLTLRKTKKGIEYTFKK